MSNELKFSISADLYKIKSVADFWDEKMPMLCMEECGELIQAVSKVERKGLDVDTERNLKEEIRDIYISLMAIQFHYNISDTEIEEMIGQKLDVKKEK